MTPTDTIKMCDELDAAVKGHSSYDLNDWADEIFNVTKAARLEAKMREALVTGTHSHVDGRDLLAELKPNAAHFIDIKVRINGQWREYEGDWLKRLMHLRDAALTDAGQ